MDLPLPLGPHPFTRAQVLACGLPAWRWREAVDSGGLHRMRRGVYVLEPGRDDWTRYVQRVAAELVTRSDHFAVAESAAAFHGLPNPFFGPWCARPVLIAGPKSRPDRGIESARGRAPVETPWGLAVDPTTAALALAVDLPLPQALMVVDHVARGAAGTQDRFVLAGRDCRDRVRSVLAEHTDTSAAHWADPAAESPAESFYRGHMMASGFPEPRCGVPKRGASGRQYFLDLMLDGLAIEIDGKGKYSEDPLRTMVEEKTREDDLRDGGIGVHRVFVENLYADPATEMRRLHDRWSHHIRRPA